MVRVRKKFDVEILSFSLSFKQTELADQYVGNNDHSIQKK
jgi:hypothetical protein